MRTNLIHEKTNCIFNYITANNTRRLMTIINGIPFYQSSGLNSGHPKTWLPFRGIKESSGWIMKPSKEKLNKLPDELREFIDENDIDEDISIHRFGNLYTMCISATIGMGFWNTTKGIQLREFLQKNYSHYFIQHPIINEISGQFTDYELVDSRTVANERLKQLGSYIPLGQDNSHFFTEIEMNVILSLKSNPNLYTIMQHLNLAYTKISPEKYQDIIELLQKLSELNLLQDAANEFIFESDYQIITLIKLMKENKLSAQSLRDVNLLNVSEENKKVLHDLLQKDFLLRNCYRILAKKHIVNHETIDLIITLKDKELLEDNADLFSDNNALAIMLNFKKIDYITIDSFALLRKLYDKDWLISDYRNYNVNFFGMLQLLDDIDKLNEGTISFIKYLYDNNLVNEQYRYLEKKYCQELISLIPTLDIFIACIPYLQSKETCKSIIDILGKKSPDKQMIDHIISTHDERLAKLILTISIKKFHIEPVKLLLTHFKHLDLGLPNKVEMLERPLTFALINKCTPLIEHIFKTTSTENQYKLLPMLRTYQDDKNIITPLIPSLLIPLAIKLIENKEETLSDCFSLLKGHLDQPINDQGDTLMHLAVKSNNAYAVGCLNTFNANCHQNNLQDISPFDLATAMNDQAMLFVINKKPSSNDAFFPQSKKEVATNSQKQSNDKIIKPDENIKGAKRQ